MCVVQPHAAVKVHESERDLHNLHTFEHRLSWLYTWPQQAKKGGKSKIYGANAPQLSAIWPQATTGTHVPPLHQRWRGGQGVRPPQRREKRSLFPGYSLAAFTGTFSILGPIQTVWMFTNSCMPKEESSRP